MGGSDSYEYTIGSLRLDALQLLQCESKEEGRRKGLVNGMGIFQKGEGPGKGHAMCIAQIDGLERKSIHKIRLGDAG